MSLSTSLLLLNSLKLNTLLEISPVVERARKTGLQVSDSIDV